MYNIRMWMWTEYTTIHTDTILCQALFFHHCDAPLIWPGKVKGGRGGLEEVMNVIYAIYKATLYSNHIDREFTDKTVPAVLTLHLLVTVCLDGWLTG